MKKDCIFCQISKNQLPSYKIYEDKDFVCFLDKNPKTRGHCLLIPKKHYRWIYDLSEKDFKNIWKVAYKITKAFKKYFNFKYLTFGTHGLDVEHAHIHILPMKTRDSFIPKKDFFQTDEDKEKITLELKKILSNI